MNTKGSSPYHITGAPRQRNLAQMEEQIKTPEKLLSNEELHNQSIAEFKILVIRRFTEIIEYGHKIKKKCGLYKVK